MVMGSIRQKTEVVIVGGGPGGYVAAIRAADLGHEVAVVEQRGKCGGVCLWEGCIPSKTFLSAVRLLRKTREFGPSVGIACSGLKIDPEVLRSYADRTIEGLAKGVHQLLRSRGVEVIAGTARLDGRRSLRIEGSDVSGLDFKKCVLASGSRASIGPEWRELGVWTSREALELQEIPERLLVIGGGVVGVELGLVYAGLGSFVTVVELMDGLLPGTDPEIVGPVRRRCSQIFDRVLLNAMVTALSWDGESYLVRVKSGSDPEQEFRCDGVLAATGRLPNTDDIGVESAGVLLGDDGLVRVNNQMESSSDGIYAVGDIVAGPALAHKATREGRIVAEAINGLPAAYDNVAMPAVVYCDPELAWVGIDESEAKSRGISIRVGRFPFSALGRGQVFGESQGIVKIVAERDSGLILGVGVAGSSASELISEGCLALEMGALIEDLRSTVHPHPTFSEAISEAADDAANSSVHLPPPRRD